MLKSVLQDELASEDDAPDDEASSEDPPTLEELEKMGIKFDNINPEDRDEL